MSFDRPRDAVRAVDQVLPSNQRRTFLEVLDQVIGETQPGLRSGLVTRQGCPVLFVLNSANIAHRADIGCDFDTRAGWTFTWAADGRTIESVSDTRAVAQVVARTLRATSSQR
ncbi:hypothetical protein [Actinomadura oligospora]|uniref:hypothetical protein n=1 Tax=Actinomadura oligospora TaxID=111804 RepID=UPI0012F7158D|nr:hypothetical protein [Actinomadura oligospora]